MKLTDLLEPVDELHYECMNARQQIRRKFLKVKKEIAVWEPASTPEDWV